MSLNRLSRRLLLSRAATATAGLGASGLLPEAAEAAPETLNFVLIGDWGRAGRDHQTDVANQLGQTAAAIGSRFTVSMGDNFYENGVTGLDDPYWRTSFEEIYTAPSLQSPWRVILGNHDYRGNVQAQLDYTKQSPRWSLPARYYALSEALPGGGTADFFYVDTSPFIRSYINSRTDISGQDTDAQLRWLDTALGRSTADWKIVIGHHPIYTAQADADGYIHDQPDLIARLNPILVKHQVPIYINGHDHTLQVVRMGGITYVTNGAGSATYAVSPPIRNGFASGAHGFMTCALSREALSFALIDMAGHTLYAQTLARPVLS